MFSKAAVVAALGAGVGAVMYGLAKMRPSSTSGANVPVDEELVPRGYVVDPAQAHAERLDEDAHNRSGWVRYQRKEGNAAGQVETRKAAGRAGGAFQNGQSKPPVDMTRDYLVEDIFVTHEEKRAREERERARRAQERAQEAGAEAAAALAASQVLKDKLTEAQRAVEAETSMAHRLEEEAATHRQAAWAARRLAANENKSMLETEAEAARKLREEKKAMEKAVREAEAARKAARAAEAQRLAAIEARDAAAVAKMRNTTARTEALARAAEREAAAAEAAKRKADADAAEAQRRLAELATAEKTARDAQQRQQDTKNTIVQARALLDQAEKDRTVAEAAAAAARKDAERFRLATNTDQEEVRKHSAAVEQYRKAIDAAKQELAEAAALHDEAATLKEKVTAWWSGKPDEKLQAVSSAVGTAYARDVNDSSLPVPSAVEVVAEGSAKVDIVPVAPAPRNESNLEVKQVGDETVAVARTGGGWWSRLLHPASTPVQTEATLEVHKASDESIARSGPAAGATDAAEAKVTMKARQVATDSESRAARSKAS